MNKIKIRTFKSSHSLLDILNSGEIIFRDSDDITHKDLEANFKKFLKRFPSKNHVFVLNRSYEGEEDVDVYEVRDETDDEYNKRIERSEKARERTKLKKEKKKEEEFKEYQRLKAIYGN